MKIVVLLISAIISSMSTMAINYFQPGMHWTVEHYSTASPTPVSSTEEIYLDDPIELQDWFPAGKETDNMFTLWSYNQESSNNKDFLGWIMTEGDKIFAIQPPRANFVPKDWTLWYDFGLEDGERCEVTPILTGNNDPENFVSVVTCISQRTISSNQVEMTMKDEGGSSFNSTGIWVKGIGSTSGVLKPNRFETDGGRSELLQAEFKGEVIYENPALSSIIKNSIMPVIRIVGQSIVINNSDINESIDLIDENGNILYHAYSRGESVTITPEQKGIYIVKVGKNSVKVIL